MTRFAAWWIFSLLMLAVFLYAFSFMPPLPCQLRLPRWNAGHRYQEDDREFP